MVIERKAFVDEVFKGFVGVHDLNFVSTFCDASRFQQSGLTHELGKDAVRTTHGVRAVEDVWAHRGSASGRCGREEFGLCRCLSHLGLLAADLARVVAGHSRLFGGQPSQALSHGTQRSPRSRHACRCAEPARLAHLSGPCDALDCAGANALRQRPDRLRRERNQRAQRHGVRA